MDKSYLDAVVDVLCERVEDFVLSDDPWRLIRINKDVIGMEREEGGGITFTLYLHAETIFMPSVLIGLALHRDTREEGNHE